MPRENVEVLIESYSGYALKVKVSESDSGHVFLDIDGSGSTVDVVDLREALDYVTGDYVSSRKDSE